MKTPGYIELNDMTFFAYHGVLEQEKKVGNSYQVDLRIYFDFLQASISDQLSDTINYADIYQIVKKEMEIPSQLLEHLSGRINAAILEQFNQIEKVKIKISKINPPIEGDIRSATVMLESCRNIIAKTKCTKF